MAESIHEKLKRVRKPHVHITMDIDGDGLPVRELPFVLGVMGDFTGDPTEAPKPLGERRFIEIDRDNFNDVMARMKPALEMRVANTMTDEGGDFAVQLAFESMEDFDPAKVVQQVPALKKLLETRDKLKQLANAVDRSRGGDRVLEQILQDPSKLDALAAEVKKSEASQSGGDEE